MATLDIPTLVAESAAQAFELFDSIRIAVTFKRVVPGTYNPTAGTDPATTVSTNIRPIPLTFKSEEVDGKMVKSGDKKLLILASELPLQPKSDDYVVDGANKRWDVTEYKVPTTDKLWIIGVRAHQP